MKMRNRLKQALTLVLAGLFSAQSAEACTRVLWAAPDGQVLVERTGAVVENPHKWTSK